MTARQKGICCILTSAFGFALMAMFVRLCDDYGGPVNCFQKSLFRNLIAFFIAAAVYARNHRRGVRRSSAQASRGERGALTLPDTRTSKHPNTQTPGVPPKAWFLMLGRSASGVLGIFGNFYALSIIPIGEAMTLNKTAPFFAVLFSWLFLREKAGVRQFFFLLLAFAGAMLVMKPGFRGDATFATVCALVGGLGAGIAYTCVRELGLLKVEGSLIVLFFSAFSTLASLPFLLGGFDPMTWPQVLILLGAGCGAAVGQFGVTAAYRFAPPKEIAVFDYTNVIFTALFGFALFGQVPDHWSVLGFLLIVFAGVRSRG